MIHQVIKMLNSRKPFDAEVEVFPGIFVELKEAKRLGLRGRIQFKDAKVN